MNEASMYVQKEIFHSDCWSEIGLSSYLSTTFTFFRISSASLEEMASLVTVLARVVSAFLASSSINMILLVRAEMSDSI